MELQWQSLNITELLENRPKRKELGNQEGGLKETGTQIVCYVKEAELRGYKKVSSITKVGIFFNRESYKATLVVFLILKKCNCK